MNQQDNETVNYLMSDENDEQDFFQFDDLALTDEQLAEIKGGTCLGCTWGPPIFNHNETTAEDDANEIELDDLMLSDVQENDIKAGCLGCTWGPPILNHNETAVEEDEDKVEALADLPVEDGEQVKGGPGSGSGGGSGKATFQDLHLTAK